MPVDQNRFGSVGRIAFSDKGVNPRFSIQDDYAADFRAWLDERRKRYGTLEAGEAPLREADLPRQTSDGLKTRRFTRTFLESAAYSDAVAPAVAQALMDESLSYAGVSDKSAQAYAEAVVGQGAEDAERIWLDAISSDRVPDKQEVALGERLLFDASQRGDTEATIKRLAELAEIGTRAGQTVQAMRMLKRIGGIGQLYYLQRSVDTMNKTLAKRAKRPVTLRIDENLAGALARAKTEGSVGRAADAILDDLAKQMPQKWVDRWTAWRYLSMLGNPRTHVRNNLGNAVFMPAIKLKNLLASAMESAVVKPGERTKAAVSNRAYKDFAAADFDKVKDTVSGGGKMNPESEIRDRRRVFGDSAPGRLLEGASNLNTNLLELEDAFFLKRHYQAALAGWLQGNKADLTNLSNATLEKARQYAILEAQKATYRDASKMATAIQRLSQESPVAQLLVEGVLPFKKTPINIIKRGVEYSPVGLLNTITRGARQLAAGSLTTAQFIDGLASGLTGTGILALGAFLSSLGVLTGSLGDTPEEQFQALQGEQPYAMRLFGHTYTLDWMTPVALPLFVGVELWNMRSAETETLTFWDAADALTGIVAPAFNLSMLDGINSLIESARYAEQPILEIIQTAGLNYLSQGVPTLFGQMARVVDGTRRRTYADRNQEAPSSLQLAWQRTLNKIPGASMANEAWVDKWGEEDVEQSALLRVLENFISPGYLSKQETDGVERELQTLYEQTRDETLLPRNAAKYFSFDGTRIDLTAEQYTAFATARGQTAHKLLEGLFAAQDYAALNDRQKIDAVADVYAYANAVAKTKVSGYTLEGWMSRAGDDVVGSVITRQAEAEEERMIDAFRENLAAAVLAGDETGSLDAVEALRLADKSNAGIKSSLTSRVRATYQAAYRARDMETVNIIEDTLLALGIGFSPVDFDKWVEGE